MKNLLTAYTRCKTKSESVISKIKRNMKFLFSINLVWHLKTYLYHMMLSSISKVDRK